MSDKVSPTPEAGTAPPEQVNPRLLQAVRAAVAEGTIYTWQDGEHTRRVRLVRGLVLQPNSDNTEDDQVVAGDGARSIVIRQARHATDSEPVFVSEVGGGLMTLPGGVLLALNPNWGERRINRFFSDNGIKLNRVSTRAFSDNAFFVETEPGLPSLELANELASQRGVRISVPNWAREMALR